RLPVVFDEAHIMHRGIDADAAQRFQIQVLDILGIGLQCPLRLIVVLQAVGVFAIAAIGRATRRLNIGGVPGLGTHGSQEGGSVEGTGAHFHVVGLQYHAALLRPVALQGEDQVLEGAHGRRSLAHEITCSEACVKPPSITEGDSCVGGGYYVACAVRREMCSTWNMAILPSRRGVWRALARTNARAEGYNAHPVQSRESPVEKIKGAL